MLPLNLKPYAVNWIEKECKSSCDISSNDSMNLCIGLHGRLKLSIVGRNQILPKDGVIIISLRMRNGNSIPLFDSRKDGYGSLDEEESQFDCTHPFLPLAVCPKCQSSEFQLHFDFEYPELNELDILSISRPDKAFTWIWISLTCSRCRSVFHCNLETD